MNNAIKHQNYFHRKMLFEFLSEAFTRSLFVIIMLSIESEYYCKITGKHPMQMQLTFPIVVAVKYWIEF